MKKTNPPRLPVFGKDGSVSYFDITHMPAILDRLFEKLRIAVIFAGDKAKVGGVKYSAQNVRDWKSYESVAAEIQRTLKANGFRHVFLMPDDWTLLDNLDRDDIHFAWLNTGGVQGYNSTAHAPSMLEMMGIPYIGHDPLNVSILDNKDIFKRQLISLGIQTPTFLTWNKSKYSNNPYWLEDIPPVFGEYMGPFVVKPVSGRASKNVYFCETMVELPRFVDKVYSNTRNNVLIEKYLPGAEYCVSIFGWIKYANGKFERYNEPFAFSEVERLLEKDEKIFTSMDQRALTGDRFRLLRKKTDAEIKKKLQELASSVFRYLNLTTLIRLDVRADADGELYIMESNPKPDLKKPEKGVISIVTIGLEEHGMSYDDLIMSIFCARIHYLFKVQRGYINHVVDLIVN